MRIPSGKINQSIYFVAVDATDLKTRETGLTGFAVYRSRNGGAPVVYTTPTVTELSAANMPGVYGLLVDEDTTIAAGSDSEEYAVHITQAAMAPVTRSIELYRRDTTTGNTVAVNAAGGVTLADGVAHGGALGSSTATLALSRASIISQTTNSTALTVTGNGTGDGATLASGVNAGNGATFSSGSGSGHGISAVGGAISGNGIATVASGSGHGISAVGGAINGNGISAFGDAPNGSGLAGFGIGTGHGILATGGATGHGMSLQGGATSGVGLRANGGPDSDGILASGTGTGDGAQFNSGTGVTGSGIRGVSLSTDGRGLELRGSGAEPGLYSLGGETGHGARFIGGATSGDGINTTGTGAGDGIQAIGTGGQVDIRANITGNITGTVATVTIVNNLAANTVNAAAIAADAIAEIADGVWEEPMSGHTTIGTFGQGAFRIRASTAQGGTSNTIQLDAGASALNDFYNNQLLVITSGTGVNQARYIADYDGATRNASVNFIWDTDPDATSQFVIVPGGIVGSPVPTIADIATAVWSYLVDPPRSAEESMRLHNSAMGGKASGLDTTTAVYRDLADTKDRVTATVDSFGNRTAVVLDLT
jgi:hypothetical protein